MSLGHSPLRDGPLVGRRSRVLFVLAVFCALSLACSPLCVSEEQLRIPSPDGKVEAVLFQRDCGATTDFSTQVSVLPSGARLGDAGGNVFIADADHSRAPRASWGGPPASMRWQGLRHLVVTYHPLSRVFLEERSVHVQTGWFRSELVAIEFVRGS